MALFEKSPSFISNQQLLEGKTSVTYVEAERFSSGNQPRHQRSTPSSDGMSLISKYNLHCPNVYLELLSPKSKSEQYTYVSTTVRTTVTVLRVYCGDVPFVLPTGKIGIGPSLQKVFNQYIILEIGYAQIVIKQ